ncbi:hypothetical protein N473_01080 [Pseudoalteromonas luteoviolacea CPMOR-1]|uniref:Pentapeptide repeat protein n=1 Tax=Pseudoalteromonas luteoviolacea CPMOR-1 TaxID=1365248 RepID=A0A162CBH7_9GAMM|nr:pentapeptide repeat-containing protein [Pseudoalteromonas luteoviolacea]KZN65194.1 hypothetical protein N473_01080 [Pseudoalteromonas luteoviolacea CPMOR-1]
MIIDKNTNKKEILNYFDEMSGKTVKDLKLQSIMLEDKSHSDESECFYTFKNIKFDNIKIEDCILKNIKFQNCQFSNSSFVITSFYKCQFVDCELENCSFDETHYFYCSFVKHRWIKSTIERGLISSGTIENTDVVACVYRDSIFMDVLECSNWLIQSSELKECAFHDCDLSKFFINRTQIEESHFSNCVFTASSLKDISWETLQNNKLSLCDFVDAEFSNSTEPTPALTEWNNFHSTNRVSFYLDIINKVLKSTEWEYGNYEKIEVCITRLNSINSSLDFETKERVKDWFKTLANSAQEKGDYTELGTIFKDYTTFITSTGHDGLKQLPLQSLSESKHAEILKRWEYPASLNIKLTSGGLSLNGASGLLKSLDELESLLPFNVRKSELDYIKRGSIWVKMYGDFRQLLLKGKFLDLEKTEAEVTEKKLENIVKRQAIKTTAENRALQKELQKQELIKITLENKLLSEELESKKLDKVKKELEILSLLEDISADFDALSYLSSPEYDSALKVAQEITNKYPIEKIHIEAELPAEAKSIVKVSD